MIITIDGPSASGKSTVARAVAKKLNFFPFFYIASGYLYRGLAYALMYQKGYTGQTIANVQEADVAYCLDPSHFHYQYDSVNQERIMLQGIDITAHLKSPEIDAAASIIATNPMVRSHITSLIRSLARDHDIVIDGRDCGSVLFPDANYKIYLTASLHVRAARWQAMQAALHNHISIKEAEDILAARDERDSSRSIAPLQVPQDAVVIDSSEMSIEQLVNYITYDL